MKAPMGTSRARLVLHRHVLHNWHHGREFLRPAATIGDARQPGDWTAGPDENRLLNPNGSGAGRPICLARAVL